MAEDGFREIQLNGKQLVFLFMATAVVAVVIFLSGVMVGRGVRAEKGALGEADALTSRPSEPPSARGGTEPPPSGAISTSALPPVQGQVANDELSYYNRLEAAGAPKETLKPAPPSDSATKNAPPQEPAPPAARATPPARTPVEAPKATAKASAEPPGGFFSVQVSALRSRAGADAVLKQLSARGFDGYIVGPQGGSSLYRVRVGKYKDRRDAEELGRRLEKENFKPLITR
jgi:cell division septation protein DedD